MPEFNKQLFFDPKIDIIGKEIPLAALEKTGNVLQGRYDQAMDNETKIGAVAKKLAASSNPVDRETANQILKTYQDKLATRAKDGKYFDMVWQTQRDALDVAGMYEGLANRNKQIQQGLEEINKSPKYLTDDSRNKAVIEYNKRLKSSTFNQENGILEGLNVDPFNEAADIDVTNEFLKVAPHIRTTTRSGQAAHLGYVSAKTGMPTNKPTQGDYLAKIDASGKSEILTSADIKNEMLKYGKAHTGINAMVERDLDRMEVQDPQQRVKIGNELFHNYVDNAANSMSTMFDVNNIGDKGNFQILGAYNDPNNPKSENGLDPLKPNTYTPNDVFQEYKTAGKLEFPNLLNSSLQNNKKSKATLLSALDNMVQNGNPNAKKAKEVVKGLSELSEEYPEYADIIRRSTAGQYNSAIGRIGQAMFNVGSHINNLINTGTSRSEDVIKKGQKLVDQYKELARTGIFDSKFENEFEAATNTAPLTRKLAINSVNLESDAVRTAVTKLSNDLNLNKFDILEGEWKNPEDIKINITGVSREPYGAGSGIAFELMDSKGNTVIATPKKQAAQGIVGELDKVLPGIKAANNYREMIPLSYSGQQKDFADIGEEIGNLELSKQFKGYKLILNEDGTYTRISPNGEKVNSPNPILLLPQM